MLSQDFNQVKKSLADYEKNREEAIIKSRDIIKLSKQIVYALHRGDFKGATASVNKIKAKIRGLSTKNYDTSIVSVAFQEYVEAVCYYDFIKFKKIKNFKQLGVDAESYLMGLCDLTGELVRKAVSDAIKKNYKDIVAIREFVEEIYWEFLKLDIRSNDLRRKADAIKYNLKKLDDLTLQIKK